MFIQMTPQVFALKSLYANKGNVLYSLVYHVHLMQGLSCPECDRAVFGIN